MRAAEPRQAGCGGADQRRQGRAVGRNTTSRGTCRRGAEASQGRSSGRCPRARFVYGVRGGRVRFRPWPTGRRRRTNRAAALSGAREARLKCTSAVAMAVQRHLARPTEILMGALSIWRGPARSRTRGVRCRHRRSPDRACASSCRLAPNSRAARYVALTELGHDVSVAVVDSGRR